MEGFSTFVHLFQTVQYYCAHLKYAQVKFTFVHIQNYIHSNLFLHTNIHSGNPAILCDSAGYKV